jgi:hypothetical protein
VARALPRTEHGDGRPPPHFKVSINLVAKVMPRPRRRGTVAAGSDWRRQAAALTTSPRRTLSLPMRWRLPAPESEVKVMNDFNADKAASATPSRRPTPPKMLSGCPQYGRSDGAIAIELRLVGILPIERTIEPAGRLWQPSRSARNPRSAVTMSYSHGGYRAQTDTWSQLFVRLRPA